MGDLKPIGSEKLTGQEKINRIIEISRFKENVVKNINEQAKSEFSISLADGNNYQIVKEKLGYIIKKNISESETDYIEPMKNRKYFSSYSQALKRLNLLAGELNRLNENESGVSLYGEQKKFVLKTPKPAEPAMDMPPPPAEPPSVPSPELPSSPVDDMPLDDTEGDVSAEVDVDTEVSEPAPSAEGEGVDFKQIQKLTGKLTQKMRDLDSEKGMTSEDIKYVINMVLSAADLSNLSDEDKEDILSKFEGDEMEGEMGMDDLGGDDMDGTDLTDDSEVEDIQSDMDVAVEEEMGENWGAVARVAAPMVASYIGSKMGEKDEEEESVGGAILDSIFGESKIDKVISKYFEYSESEKKKIQEQKNRFKNKMNSVRKLTETVEQEMSAQKFLEENPNFKFIGKTNLKNLVFESNKKQIKISPEGLVI